MNSNSRLVQNTLAQFRQIVHTIEIFTDIDECANFLVQIQDERVCMILSDSIGFYIVPCLHDMSQLDSIFIFSTTYKNNHPQWI